MASTLLAAATALLAFSVLHSASSIISSTSFTLQQMIPIIFMLQHMLLQQPSIAEGTTPQQQRPWSYDQKDCHPLRTQHLTWENVVCGLECITSPSETNTPIIHGHASQGTRQYPPSVGSLHVGTSHGSTSASSTTPLPFPPPDERASETPLQPNSLGNNGSPRYDILVCKSSTSLWSTSAYDSGSRVDLGEINDRSAQYSTVVFQDFGDLLVMTQGQASGTRRKTWRFLGVKRIIFISPAAATQDHPILRAQGFLAPAQSMFIENTEVIFISGASLFLDSLHMTNVTVEGFAFGFSRNIRTITVRQAYFVRISCATPSTSNNYPNYPVDDAHDVTIADSRIADTLTNCGSQQPLLKMNSLSFLNVKISALAFQAFSSLSLARLEFKDCQIGNILSHAFRGVQVTESFVFVSNKVQRLAANAFDELVIAGGETHQQQALDHSGHAQQPLPAVTTPSISTSVHGNSLSDCECSSLSPYFQTAIPAEEWTSTGRSLYLLFLKSSTCMMAHDQNDNAATSTLKQSSPESFLCSSCQMPATMKQVLNCSSNIDHEPLLPNDNQSSTRDEYSKNEKLCSCDDISILKSSKEDQFATQAADERVPEWQCKDGNPGLMIPFEHFQQHHCQSRPSLLVITLSTILAMVLILGFIVGTIFHRKYMKRGKRRIRHSVRTVIVPVEDPADDDDDDPYANADSFLSQSTTHQQLVAIRRSSMGEAYDERNQQDQEMHETSHHQHHQKAAENVPSSSRMGAGIGHDVEVINHFSTESKNDLYQYEDVSDHLYESASVYQASELYAVPVDTKETVDEGHYQEVAAMTDPASSDAVEGSTALQAHDSQDGADAGQLHSDYDVPHWD